MSLTTPETVRRLQRKLYTKAKQEPAFRFYALYDKVYREDLLAHAYQLARCANGAAGVDGETFADIEASGVETWLAGLSKELHEKTYRPDPVRRVEIPKPTGGVRPLGIPTIRDRVVQTAAKLVLEPIFEADFDASLYGYRPRRSAGQAVEAVHQALCEGYTEVVDADLARYFETIPHRELLAELERRVVDRHLLRLIKGWLKVPVEERDGRGRRRMRGGKRTMHGTPQGGVISPLLANIYMHRYTRAWRQADKGTQYRARLITYADDFVILSRGHAAEALAWSREVLAELGLQLNEAKTHLRQADRESFDFLGYRFGPACYHKRGTWYLAARPAPQSVRRVKQRIRALLHRGNQAPWPDVATELNQVLRGWAGYFRYGSRALAYRAVDNYVQERVRYFLRRRHKVPTRGTIRYARSHLYDALGVVRLAVRAGRRPAWASG